VNLNIHYEDGYCQITVDGSVPIAGWTSDGSVELQLKDKDGSGDIRVFKLDMELFGGDQVTVNGLELAHPWMRDDGVIVSPPSKQ